MTKKDKQSKLLVAAVLLASVSLLFTVVTAGVLGTYIDAQQRIADIDRQEYFKQYMRLMHLETCYANSIHPCNQDTINKFYESQPQEP